MHDFASMLPLFRLAGPRIAVAKPAVGGETIEQTGDPEAAALNRSRRPREFARRALAGG